MSNKFFNKDTAPSKQSGGQGGSNSPQGSGGVPQPPTKTAAWPGLPGKKGPNRSNGVPTTGNQGHPFLVKKEGL